MWHKLTAFVNVVELAGFAKAAKKLGVSKATITRYIHELEAEYGVTLLLRSTRHVSATEAGQQLYQHALGVLQAERTIQATLAQAQTDIVGHAKVGLPASIMTLFTQHIVPYLCQAYPQLTLELVQGNHVQDLLSSHFDLVVHCGVLPDVSFHATPIAPWHKVICAAPRYLEQHGTPKELNGLSEHICLDHADNHTHVWPLQHQGKLEPVAVHSPVRINSSQALMEAAIAGVGIVFLPSFTVQQALAQQQLVAILTDYTPPPLAMYALSSQRVSHSPKVALLVEQLRQLYQPKELA